MMVGSFLLFTVIALLTRGGCAQEPLISADNLNGALPVIAGGDLESSVVKSPLLAEEDDREKIVLSPAVGGGIVYKIEADEPVEFHGISRTDANQGTWGTLIDETDVILRSGKRDIETLLVLLPKLYGKRLMVTDRRDSKGLRRAATVDYVNAVHLARKVLCQYSTCSYGVCLLKDVNDINGIGLDTAIHSLNSDWTDRVENLHTAFKSQTLDAIQRDGVMNTLHRFCVPSVDGSGRVMERDDCGSDGTTNADVWNAYVYTPKDIAFINLLYERLGTYVLSRQHLQNVAKTFTTCACYKGFHGVGCDRCSCSDTPGIYDEPVVVEVTEKEL